LGPVPRPHEALSIRNCPFSSSFSVYVDDVSPENEGVRVLMIHVHVNVNALCPSLNFYFHEYGHDVHRYGYENVYVQTFRVGAHVYAILNLSQLRQVLKV
jgi:hypothetical protein